MTEKAQEYEWDDQAPQYEFEDTPGVMPQAPAPPGPGPYEALQRGYQQSRSRIEGLSRKDPGIDYDTGVKSLQARYMLSLADTEEERVKTLDELAGKGNWYRDSFGAIVVRPSGLEKLGQSSTTDVAWDERTGFAAPLRDIADIGQDLPAIGAGIGAGMATGGWGVIPSTLGITAATTVTSGLQEAAESLAGKNLEPPEDVVDRLQKEAVLTAAFTGAGEALRPLGRGLLGPNRSRVLRNPKRGQVFRESEELGVKLGAGQVSGRSLLLRAEGMFKTIFGDLTERPNAEAFAREIHRLKSAAGRRMLRVDLGKMITDNVRTAARTFRSRAGRLYAVVDDLSGGQPFVPTAALKATAKEIEDEIAKTAVTVSKGPVPSKALARGAIKQPSKRAITRTGGEPIFATERVIIKDLRDLQKLPDSLTYKQMQAIRSSLFDQYYQPTMAPGLTSNYARRLHKAAGQGIDDAMPVNPQAAQAWQDARSYYRDHIDKFDDALIAKITLDPKEAGHLDPELILDRVWRKKNPTKLMRVMRVLPDNIKEPIRRQAMDDLLIKIVREKDVFTPIYDGMQLKRALDSYGDEALDAMFGQGTRQELYRLSRVAAATTIEKSSGIVAAAVALHPLKNAGKLIRFRAIQSMLASKPARHWLTVGFEAKTMREAVAAVTRALTIGMGQNVGQQTGIDLPQASPVEEQEQ